MADPIRLLESLSRVSNKVGIWTQYYDERVILSKKHLKKRFDKGVPMTWRGKSITGLRQKYHHQEPNLLSFIGGNKPYSTWLKKKDIISILEELGFSVVIGIENMDGQYGPELLLYASR
jgi:hypothetical protein